MVVGWGCWTGLLGSVLCLINLSIRPSDIVFYLPWWGKLSILMCNDPAFVPHLDLWLRNQVQRTEVTLTTWFTFTFIFIKCIGVRPNSGVKWQTTFWGHLRLCLYHKSLNMWVSSGLSISFICDQGHAVIELFFSNPVMDKGATLHLGRWLPQVSSLFFFFFNLFNAYISKYRESLAERGFNKVLKFLWRFYIIYG